MRGFINSITVSLLARLLWNFSYVIAPHDHVGIVSEALSFAKPRIERAEH